MQSHLISIYVGLFLAQGSFFFFLNNRSKFIPVGYYFQDSLVIDINHLISAATVNNWAPETLFSIFCAESSYNLRVLPWVRGAMVPLPLAFSFIIYLIYFRTQNKLELAKKKKKWRERLWNDHVQGPHDLQEEQKRAESKRKTIWKCFKSEHLKTTSKRIFRSQ